MRHSEQAFTLIELLIVVAIIAILAAIAVPNFLEAQVRAKVSRTKSDFRSLATALEDYHVDNGNYPITYVFDEAAQREVLGNLLFALSTPIAYVSSSHLEDPFGWRPDNDGGFGAFGTIDGVAYYHARARDISKEKALIQVDPEYTLVRWILWGRGPDQIFQFLDLGGDGNPTLPPRQAFALASYDPTNGSVSAGDINRTNFKTD